MTQARFFTLCSLHEINAVQNISKLIFVNIDLLSICQHLFDNINKQYISILKRLYFSTFFFEIFVECQIILSILFSCWENVVVIINKQQNYIVIVFLTNNTKMIESLHDLCCINDNPVQKRQRCCINILERDYPQVVAVLAMETINPHVPHTPKFREN